MSTASDPLDLRRAAFRDALRRGDLLAAARASARLQAHANGLDAREFLLTRDARIALGRAIREARSRRTTVPRAVVVEEAVPARRPRRLSFAVAAALVVLAVALSGWLVLPRDAGDLAGGGTPAVAADVTVPITPQSRGRVVLAVAAVPVAEQPQATAVPEPITVLASPGPAATSGPSVAPVGTGPSGSGVPGPGSGVGGVRSASPRPTVPPRPTPLPPLARGFARLTGLVVDGRTGRGLPDACVSLGPCTAVSPRTDAFGFWTLDLPVGSGGLDWGLEFAKTGYTMTSLSVRARTGYIFLPAQWLSPTG